MSSNSSPPLSEHLCVASRTIARVLQGESLTDALPSGRHPAVQDLVYGSLRAHGVGDALLRPLLRRPLSDVVLRAVLLCALYELRRERAAAHTVVNEAVSACARLGHGAAKGLVNAVLRNYLRQRSTLEARLADSEVAHYQHPQWWIDRLRAAYPDCWEDTLTASNTHPPMTLRVNRRRVSRADYLALLQASGIDAAEVGESGLQLARPRPVQDLPGFAEGLVSVQDAGAQYAALLLDLQDGQRVLDACAAPGGKTGHISELAQVELWALDQSAPRTARISETLQRLGGHAQVKVADAATLDEWWDGRPFDRILLDAPCTGSGVARRFPDIKWLRRESDIESFAAQQQRLLDALWPLLAPGGKLLYVTCSVFPEENRLQTAAFLARHSDASSLPVPLPRAGQLLPDAAHDGFYYALLGKA